MFEIVMGIDDFLIQLVKYCKGVIYYAGADGNKITLAHHENATDVTYSKVMQFIESDTTDQIPFQKEKFTCGDHAELVQNNAENAGIRYAWVSIDFEWEGNGHACNVFNTTDRGLGMTRI